MIKEVTIHRSSIYLNLVLLLTLNLLHSSQGWAKSNDFKWPTIETIVDSSVDRNIMIAQSGEVIWSLLDAERYLKRYRAWLNWESSAPQPLSTLNDISALRRLLIVALEREVIVREAKRTFLSSNTASDHAVNRANLVKWLMSLIPGSIRPSLEGLDDFIRGRLKMKPESDLSFFWLAIEDAYWVERFKTDLVAKLAEADAESEWKKQGTLLSTVILQIPRVPTSQEITAARKRLDQEIRQYYQDNLNLFSQPLRLLVEPFWIEGGKSETERLQAVEIRKALEEGATFERIKELYPLLATGSPKTLRGRSIPKDTELKEGAISPVRLTRYGWTFYLIKRIYPEYQRALSERSVEREVTAAVLRERDELPRAQNLAQKARELLSSGKDMKQINAWARSNRVRISQPSPFFESEQGVIPSIGLAPELHKQLFELKVGEVTTSVHVRQHYLVARLNAREERSDDWANVKEEYIKSWRLKRSSQILDEWLTQHLKDQKRWLKTPELHQFRPETLRFESELSAKQESQDLP